jgi:hypothetical protein
MANAMYNIGKFNLESALVDWTGSVWYAALVSSSYSVNLATDTTKAAFNSDILGTPALLSGLSISSSGQISANDPVFSGISSGTICSYIVVYYDNGSGTTFPFLYYDTGAGIPLTSTGAPITISWNGVVGSGPLMTL